MYVCICKGITEQQVQCALAEHGPDPQRLIAAFALNRDCCGRCAENIEALVQLATEHPDE